MTSACRLVIHVVVAMLLGFQRWSGPQNGSFPLWRRNFRKVLLAERSLYRAHNSSGDHIADSKRLVCGHRRMLEAVLSCSAASGGQELGCHGWHVRLPKPNFFPTKSSNLGRTTAGTPILRSRFGSERRLRKAAVACDKRPRCRCANVVPDCTRQGSPVVDSCTCHAPQIATRMAGRCSGLLGVGGGQSTFCTCLLADPIHEWNKLIRKWSEPARASLRCITTLPGFPGPCRGTLGKWSKGLQHRKDFDRGATRSRKRIDFWETS